ncbi:hypothetical protein [Desulfonema magnum]|nr:hypothetical protein [Desulfonema magnum]
MRLLKNIEIVMVCVMVQLMVLSSALTAAPVVGIYCGKGVTAGYLWHAYPLESRNIPICFFTEKDAESLNNVDVICFPSGGMYKRHISLTGRKHLKQLIREKGVGYLGTCGGNVFGCKLGLLDADLMKAEQGYPFGVQINGYPEMKVEGQNSECHPAMKNAPDMIRPFYYWGQVFTRTGPDVTVLATYKQMDNCFTFDGILYQGKSHEKMSGRPGMIAGQYGKGRVILSGPHPELGEEQLFTDWIYYLSGSRHDSDQLCKTNFTPSETAIQSDSRASGNTALSVLKSQIESFKKEVAPYEKTIRPDYERRWKHGITTGIPIFVIFTDICDRLKTIEQSISFFEKHPEAEQTVLSEPVSEQYVRQIRDARNKFSDGVCHLEKSREILRKIEKNISDKIECDRLKKTLYSASYKKLISDFKSVNLCLIRLDHHFRSRGSVGSRGSGSANQL